MLIARRSWMVTSYSKVELLHLTTGSPLALERLEPCDGKLTRMVLRGAGAGDSPRLARRAKNERCNQVRGIMFVSCYNYRLPPSMFPSEVFTEKPTSQTLLTQLSTLINSFSLLVTTPLASYVTRNMKVVHTNSPLRSKSPRISP